MTRTEILKIIEEQHAQIVATLAEIPEEVIVKRRLVEWWTIKDLLGHVAMCEQIAIQFIAEYKQDGCPKMLGMTDDDAIDAQNKREATRRRDWGLKRIRAEFDDTYRDLVAAIESLSDDDVIKPLPAPWGEGATLERLIAVNSYQHIPEHIEQIEKWQAAQ